MKYRWTVRIFVIFIMLWMAQSIEWVEIVAGNVTTVMYNKGVYETQFMKSSYAFSCSLKSLFAYRQSPQNLQNNSPYQITILGVSQQT